MSRKRELLGELGAVLAGPPPAPLPPQPPLVVLDKPGLYQAVPFADYLADSCIRPSLNPSIAKVLLQRSPLHAHHEHPRLGRAKVFRETKALDVGSVVHALVLGKGLTGGGQEYHPLDFDDYRTKAAQAARDDARAAGRIPILRRHLEACAEVARRLDDVIPASAQREVTAVWESTAGLAGGPVLCRRRIDALIIDETLVLDLKTCENAALTSEGRSLVAFGRDVEAASTLDCLDTLFPDRAGRWRFEYVFAEVEPPYDVVQRPVAGAMLEVGRSRWKRAREVWGWCLARNEWPGASRALNGLPAAPPAWFMEAEFDQQLLHADFMRGGPAADLMED